MPVLPILAYGFSTTFKVKELAQYFAGATLRYAKGQIAAEYAPDRVAVAFDFGAVVFINVASEERARVVGALLSKVATDEPHPPLEEDFLVEVKPGVPPHGEVHFDRVLVPELTGPVVDMVSLLLAQSVSIDYYEEDLQEIMGSLDKMTAPLARRGKQEGSTRDMVKFVGSTLSGKNQIIAALALLDKPSITWESESLDRLYRDLHQMLEIEDRFRALEYKLRTIQETLELLLEMVQTRKMLWLEATIVVLILVEIVMSVAGKIWPQVVPPG